MEIIHLILGKANPNRMNGVNKVVDNLARTQTELGHQVTVWGITPNLEHNYPERPYGTRLFPAVRHKLWVHRALLQAIREQHHDTVFHLHGGFIPEFFHLAASLRRAGFSYVFTPHGAYNTVAMEKSQRVKRWYFRFFEHRVVRHAKAVHMIGQSEVDAFRLRYPNKPVSLIPNGQSTEAAVRPANSLESGSGPVFGFCGRIDIHTKGLDKLVRGFRHYTRQLGGTGELWFIGDHGDMPALQEMVRDLDIAEHVRFFGKRFGQEKLEILQQMDAFCHPSRNEGLPGAVLEAAAMELPCIVSQESNMREYINEHSAGIGLKETTSQTIAHAMQLIRHYRDTGEIEAFRKNALDMIRNVFDWRIISRQLIHLYQQPIA
ncbi:MAG: glycosyltransferase family 4 protein [Bacteroidota bacterium]